MAACPPAGAAAPRPFRSGLLLPAAGADAQLHAFLFGARLSVCPKMILFPVGAVLLVGRSITAFPLCRGLLLGYPGRFSYRSFVS